jgi:hypothetical protein
MWRRDLSIIASLMESVEGNYYQAICEAGVFELAGLMKI